MTTQQLFFYLGLAALGWYSAAIIGAMFDNVWDWIAKRMEKKP